MVYPSSRTARSTSLDSSSVVRDDGVPERELRIRLTAGSGHSGIVMLTVGGEGAYWLEEAPAEATIVFVARHALAICWRGGSTSRRRRGRSCCCVSWTTRRCRPWMYCNFAAIARKRLEQQPLLPPHRRSHHQASRPARDGRCPDYCCCVLVASVVIVAMPLPLLAT